jgi:hypothetical protein
VRGLSVRNIVVGRWQQAIASAPASSRPACGAFIFALALVAGCTGGRNIESDEGCTSDIDCGDFRRCDTANKVCRCTSDDACDDTEFCNVAGSCQPKTECIDDEDCRTADNPTAVCDTRQPHPNGAGTDDGFFSSTAGQCVTLSAQTQCLIDSHCPFGYYCQSAQCTPGCRDNGDCALGDPCINNQCNATPGACNELGYCEFGQVCNAATSTCVDHADADTLCQRCDSQFGSPCPDACLIDNSVFPSPCSGDGDCERGICIQDRACIDDSDCPIGTCEGGNAFFPGTCTAYCGDFFCGSTDCNDQTNPCPRGYSCFTLVVTSDVSCTRAGGECPADSFCSADAPGENQESGFCACGPSVSCPLGTECVDGGCLIGSTCAPASGLLCEDLR